MGPSYLCPYILTSCLPDPHPGILGQHLSLPRGRRAFPPSPSWLPPRPEGSRISMGIWKWPILLCSPPTNIEQSTNSEHPPRWGAAGWVCGAPPCPWPASVAMATQSLAVGTVGLLGVLPVWVAEDGEGGQGQKVAALLMS